MLDVSALEDLSSMTIPILCGVSIVTLTTLYKLTNSVTKSDRVGNLSLLNNKSTLLAQSDVQAAIGGYEELFDGARSQTGATTTEASIGNRQKEYQTMVNSFYNLVTDFYEYGWGQCFHFAPRFKGETFNESILRAEHHLCSKLSLSSSMKVLDVGCGVGGPARNISQFSKASVTGVTINAYQVKVGTDYNNDKGLGEKVKIIQGDFQQLTTLLPKGSFDAAYEIEATCHSPDKVQTFSGVAHCLKEGGLFAGYEWCVLPVASGFGGYDKNNSEHVRVKEGIEVGNGLPTLATPLEVVAALEKAGFKVLEHYDANENQNSKFEIPWFHTLEGRYTMKEFRMTTIGRNLTHIMVNVLEFLRIAPKGSARVSALLNATALDLVEGGQQRLFTPSYYFLAQKVK